MKKLNLLFTALLLLCCVGTAKAEEVIIDGIKYDVVAKAKQAKVIASETKYSGNICIPATVVHNGSVCNVTSISDYAFSNCYDLKSVEIPNSVTSIGTYTFVDCRGLKNITIPNSVTKIGTYAFYGCSSLESVDFLPTSITSINTGLFEKCHGLKNVTIPNHITSIMDRAFNNCLGLENVIIGSSVESIGNRAFESCTVLKGITIANSVTKIDGAAFRGCYSLTEIRIPNSVKHIGEYTFKECTKLSSVTISNSIKSIPDGMFLSCPALTDITFPENITVIGREAFQNCTGLVEITIPDKVGTIGDGAFWGCHGLRTVVIGSRVSLINGRAFGKCSNLTDVYHLAAQVPEPDPDLIFGGDIFYDSYPQYMTLHVHAEALDGFKRTAPWSSFGKIVAIEDGDFKPEIPEVKVCATPVISYSDGNLHFECETEGAEFITDVTCSDIKKFYDSDINFSATYNIAVYAMATGYENSETVNATLCWIECECDGGDDTGVINIPAKAALVTSNNGVLSISCQLDGEAVAVYTTDGVIVSTATIDNGTATIATDLSKGAVAIVKIAEKSIKVIIN